MLEYNLLHFSILYLTWTFTCNLSRQPSFMGGGENSKMQKTATSVGSSLLTVLRSALGERGSPLVIPGSLQCEAQLRGPGYLEVTLYTLVTFIIAPFYLSIS